jgi:hypothetical protein
MSLARKNNYEYIKKSLEVLDDNMINDLYDKISENINKTIKKKKIGRIDKMLFIDANLKFVFDKDLEDYMEIVEESFKEPENDRKIRIILELINKVLVVIEYDQIETLCDFIEISREDLLKDEVRDIFEKNKKNIYKVNKFNRKSCVPSSDKIKNPHLVMLKGILKEVGYKLVSKNRIKNIEGEPKMTTYYNIEYMENKK